MIQPRPLSPRATEVVVAARQILEQDGSEAVTMRRLADDLGIRAPSIYKHLPGKPAIEAALIDVAMYEMGEALHTALAARGRRRPVRALLAAYRRAAQRQPNLYRLATAGELPRDRLTPGLEAWAGQPFFAATGDEHLAQALWSFAHGMVVLEIDGRYPTGSDLDATWAAGAEAFDRAARRAG